MSKALHIDEAKSKIAKGDIIYVVANEEDSVIRVYDRFTDAAFWADTYGYKWHNISHPKCPQKIKDELGRTAFLESIKAARAALVYEIVNKIEALATIDDIEAVHKLIDVIPNHVIKTFLATPIGGDKNCEHDMVEYNESIPGNKHCTKCAAKE